MRSLRVIWIPSEVGGKERGISYCVWLIRLTLSHCLAVGQCFSQYYCIFVVEEKVFACRAKLMIIILWLRPSRPRQYWCKLVFYILTHRSTAGLYLVPTQILWASLLKAVWDSHHPDLFFIVFQSIYFFSKYFSFSRAVIGFPACIMFKMFFEFQGEYLCWFILISRSSLDVNRQDKIKEF